MPILFIPGVRSRNSRRYDDAKKEREGLQNRLIVEPLMRKYPSILWEYPSDKDMHSEDCLWVDSGIGHVRYNEALPNLSRRETLGSEGNGHEWDLDLDVILQAVAREGATDPADEINAIIKQAAISDLDKFIESVLAPMTDLLFASIYELDDGMQELDTDVDGDFAALLTVAGHEVAQDPDILARIRGSESAAEILQVLSQAVRARLLRQVSESSSRTSDRPGLESLGPASYDDDSIDELFTLERFREVFASGQSVTQWVRRLVHQEVARFLGDALVYLTQRGTEEDNPGAIIKAAGDKIRTLIASYPGRPMIVLTHSLGSTIFFDLMSYYAKDITVDFWASIGSQVGLFEQMKILKANIEGISTSDGLIGREGRIKYWLNVYDPADALSFRAANVSSDVIDESYSTGANALTAHTAYFRGTGLYTLLERHIEQAISSKWK